MRTLNEMFERFVSGFEFPYFGYNYNALVDNLADLQWLPACGYVLIVENARYLLEKEREDALQGLLENLCIVSKEWAEPVTLGEWWDREGIPFHTILVFDEKHHLRDFYRRLKNVNLLDMQEI